MIYTSSTFLKRVCIWQAYIELFRTVSDTFTPCIFLRCLFFSWSLSHGIDSCHSWYFLRWNESSCKHNFTFNQRILTFSRPIPKFSEIQLNHQIHQNNPITGGSGRDRESASLCKCALIKFNKHFMKSHKHDTEA